MCKEKKTYIQPGVVIKDEYGDEHTIYPAGWMYVFAFALAGCQWAIDDIMSGKYDGWLNQGAYI